MRWPRSLVSILIPAALACQKPRSGGWQQTARFGRAHRLLRHQRTPTGADQQRRLRSRDEGRLRSARLGGRHRRHLEHGNRYPHLKGPNGRPIGGIMRVVRLPALRVMVSVKLAEELPETQAFGQRKLAEQGMALGDIPAIAWRSPRVLKRRLGYCPAKPGPRYPRRSPVAVLSLRVNASDTGNASKHPHLWLGR